MTYTLALETSSQIAAFASVAASMKHNCAGVTETGSALFLNGTNDPISPYEGVEMSVNRGLVISNQESVDYWV